MTSASFSGFPGLDVLIVKNQIPIGIENVVDYLCGLHHELFLGHAIVVSCNAHEAPSADTAEILQQVLSEGQAEACTKDGFRLKKKLELRARRLLKLKSRSKPFSKGLRMASS